jgi:hypothetical protein
LQTGFRIPSTQDQYIGLDVGFDSGAPFLLGSAPDNLTRFSRSVNLSATGTSIAGVSAVNVNGNNAYFNSYTSASVAKFAAAITAAAPTPAQLPAAITAASALLEKSNSGLVKPELVKSFDAGYRTKYKGYVIDVNGYFNQYSNFIGSKFVVAPLYGTAKSGGNFATTTEEFKSALALLNNDRRVFGLYTNTDIEIDS